MLFNKKAPDWKNAGIEPPEALKENGFQSGYKPPAAYFNWFFNRVYECIKEIQESFFEITKPEIDALDNIEPIPGQPGEIVGDPITEEEIETIIKN